jgi:FHA domain
MPQEQIITIGRDPSNSVVLNESNVSSFHARLTQSVGQIVLEDLGSTNGTSVGQVENKIQHAVVKIDDTIFFGSSSYRVSDFITSPNSLPSRPQKIEPTQRVKSKHTARWLTPPRLALAGGGGVIVVLGFILFSGNFVKEKRSEVAEEPSITADADFKEVESREAQEKVSADTKTDSPAEINSVETLSPQEKLERAMFVVVCSDPAREASYRIGTAFAVDAKHVVTTASVIQAMQELKKNGYSEATLHAPATGNTYGIVSTHLHPQYETADAEAQRAQREHDAIYDELETKPPTPEAFEAVKEQLLATRLAAIEAMERKTTYDVALIELHQDLECWLRGSAPDALPRPNLKLDVSGFGFDSNDPFFDKSDATQLLTMKGRVRQVARSSDEAPSRLLAAGTEQQFEYAFSGSPALNTQGEVVAIYSRPTPTQRDAKSQRKRDESQSDPTFDAPLFERVRECLAARP